MKIVHHLLLVVIAAGALAGTAGAQIYQKIPQKTGNRKSVQDSDPVFPAGFTSVNIAPGSAIFPSPTAIAFAPDGRIFVACQAGQVFIVQNGVRVSQAFIDLRQEVLSRGDAGMLGIALDPNFASNGYVYLSYAVDPDSDGIDTNSVAFGRVVRYQVSQSNPNVADLSSRLILIGRTWSDGTPLPWVDHAIDQLRFGTDGTLLVGIGDGGHAAFADSGGTDSAEFLPGRADPA